MLAWAWVEVSEEASPVDSEVEEGLELIWKTFSIWDSVVGLVDLEEEGASKEGKEDKELTPSLLVEEDSQEEDTGSKCEMFYNTFK